MSPFLGHSAGPPSVGRPSQVPRPRWLAGWVCRPRSPIWLCGPVDCGPPGSSVHGILQAGILEWVAMSFSRGSSWPRDPTRVSRIADGFFTIWATGEAHFIVKWKVKKEVGNCAFKACQLPSDGQCPQEPWLASTPGTNSVLERPCPALKRPGWGPFGHFKMDFFFFFFCTYS